MLHFPKDFWMPPLRWPIVGVSPWRIGTKRQRFSENDGNCFDGWKMYLKIRFFIVGIYIDYINVKYGGGEVFSFFGLGWVERMLLGNKKKVGGKIETWRDAMQAEESSNPRTPATLTTTGMDCGWVVTCLWLPEGQRYARDVNLWRMATSVSFWLNWWDPATGHDRVETKFRRYRDGVDVFCRCV